MVGVLALGVISLATRPKLKGQDVFLLSVFVFLLAHVLGELFIVSGAFNYAPALAGAQLPLRMALGPALYFYARSTMTSQAGLSIKDLSFIASGPLLTVFIILPFMLLLSSGEKLALADPATRNPEHFKLALTTSLSATILFIVYTLSFLIAASRLQILHRLSLIHI